MRPGEPVLAEVDLVRDGQEVAPRHGHDALGRNTRRQDLPKRGRRRVRHVVHADDRAPLGQEEHHRHAAEGSELHALRLHALRVRPPLRVMPDRRHRMLEGHAAVVDHRPVLPEHGEPARPAVHVALVRHGEMVRVDPLERIGLPDNVLGRPVEDDPPVLLGVHALERHRPGGEVRHHLARRVQHGDVVVLLKRHRDLAGRRDVDELRLRVLRRDFRDPREVRLNHCSAIHLPVRKRHDGDVARRHLRHPSVARVLVPLVLDRDRHERPVRRNGRRIRLPAQIAVRHRLARREVDVEQMPRRRRETLRGVDPHEHGVAQCGNRRRLPIERDVPPAHRVRRIGDVHER